MGLSGLEVGPWLGEEVGSLVVGDDEGLFVGCVFEPLRIHVL